MHSAFAALRAIKDAVRTGSWRPDPHLLKQIARRRIAIVDGLEAIRTATRIRPHEMRPLNAGGESWRVSGCDADGRRLGVGVELVFDADGNFVVIITAFVEEKRP